jgi:hypothetical protein
MARQLAEDVRQDIGFFFQVDRRRPVKTSPECAVGVQPDVDARLMEITEDECRELTPGAVSRPAHPVNEDGQIGAWRAGAAVDDERLFLGDLALIERLEVVLVLNLHRWSRGKAHYRQAAGPAGNMARRTRRPAMTRTM